MNTPMIRTIMRTLLEDLGCDKKELSILFTDDPRIAELNKKFRKKDKPTNVLAFPMAEGPADIDSGMLGDVVISVDTAIREAGDAGETLDVTIYRLLAHGLLHLLGYDHERSSKDEKIMFKEEARLEQLIKEGRNGTTGCKH
jgi:probable rRNA maturation factor